MPGKFVLRVDSEGIHWVLISPNGRTIAASFEPYPTLRSALKGVAAIRRLAPDAVVLEPGAGEGQPTTEPRTVRPSADQPPPAGRPPAAAGPDAAPGQERTPRGPGDGS